MSRVFKIILYDDEKCEGGIILFLDSRQSNVTAIKIPDVKMSGG